MRQSGRTATTMAARHFPGRLAMGANESQRVENNKSIIHSTDTFFCSCCQSAQPKSSRQRVTDKFGKFLRYRCAGCKKRASDAMEENRRLSH